MRKNAGDPTTTMTSAEARGVVEEVSETKRHRGDKESDGEITS
jgi:hypothetical protein